MDSADIKGDWIADSGVTFAREQFNFKAAFSFPALMNGKLFERGAHTVFVSCFKILSTSEYTEIDKKKKKESRKKSKHVHWLCKTL